MSLHESIILARSVIYEITIFFSQNALKNLTQGRESWQSIHTITMLIRTDAYSFGMPGPEETETGKALIPVIDSRT